MKTFFSWLKKDYSVKEFITWLIIFVMYAVFVYLFLGNKYFTWWAFLVGALLIGLICHLIFVPYPNVKDPNYPPKGPHHW
ncbi:hypothetical protein [Xylocopilactobacillus apis]|uniref:Uncharacterized protein n=1 Tax=Xylocopilactobacillus apis TaxID=2932183 RepID=A0AAU9CX26_9LACO|nr:hypothetical protein [Xylocopilactobacillus apis]BDR55914.1 hypothetical protein KIMC2_04760 [Xylocopilactobacillus apis]